ISTRGGASWPSDVVGFGTSGVGVCGSASRAPASSNVVRKTTRNRSVIAAAAYTVPTYVTDQLRGPYDGIGRPLSYAPTSGAFPVKPSVIVGNSTPASIAGDAAFSLKSRPSGLYRRCGSVLSGIDTFANVS